MYLSHGDLGGRLFLTHPTLSAASLFTHSTIPIQSILFQMSYFNDINFYASSSSSSASGELDANLFWGQMPSAEEVETQMYGTHAADWSIVGGQGPMVGSPTNFWATAGYGKYHCSHSLVRVLPLGLQTLWLRLLLTRSHPTDMIKRHISGTIGPRSTNLVFQARTLRSSTRRQWRSQLRSQPPVVVSMFLFQNLRK